MARECARHACVRDREDNVLPRHQLSALDPAGRAGRTPIDLDDYADARVSIRACHCGGQNDLVIVLACAVSA